jgi:hypothetical protein
MKSVGWHETYHRIFSVSAAARQTNSIRQARLLDGSNPRNRYDCRFVRCILSYDMARQKTDSTVLTIRVPASLGQRLAREARRRRQTRSEVARAILEAELAAGGPDLATEARRQSRLVRRRASEREAIEFILDVADITPRR